LADALLRLGHHVIGFSAPEPVGARVGFPYLGNADEVAQRLVPTSVIAVLGLGKAGVDDRRMQLMNALSRSGIHFPAIVAPTATVHRDVRLGEGIAVLDGAIVAAGSRLGRACIVDTNAGVNHDCVLGDDVHVAPGATVCGDVEIGASCLIGAGATVAPRVRESARTLIGAGVAHIHGGESSQDSLDECFRHAVTKLATVHFTATDAYRRRIQVEGAAEAIRHGIRRASSPTFRASLQGMMDACYPTGDGQVSERIVEAPKTFVREPRSLQKRFVDQTREANGEG